MIVVSDTSAITSLIQIGRADLLPRLYSGVIIPEAVARELKRNHPSLPAFLQVVAVSDPARLAKFTGELDLGEAEAITLMIEGRGDLLLMDERVGRRVAMREGVRLIGLLGVLTEARRQGLLTSLRTEIDRLETIAGFRISDELKARVLRNSGEF
jgi:predicted nucleic acid-binding protein